MKCHVTLLLTTALLSGCVARPSSSPQVMSPPPSPEALDAIRSSYKAVFPNARIGVVTAVLQDAPYALIGQIDTASLRAGTIITFLDGQETVIANGRVVKVDAGSLTVMFDAGRRRPVVGDAAIKF